MSTFLQQVWDWLPNWLVRKSPHHPACMRNRDPIWQELQRIFEKECGLKPLVKDGVKAELPDRIPVDKIALSALEVACGTGGHVEHFAQQNPNIFWQQTDVEVDDVVHVFGTFDGESQKTQSGEPQKLPNVATPQKLDLLEIANEGYLKDTISKLATRAGPLTTSYSSSTESSGSFDVKGTFDILYGSNFTHISPYECTENFFLKLVPSIQPRLVIVYGPFKRNAKFTTESNAAFDRNLKGRNESWGYRNIEDLKGLGEKVDLSLQEIVDMPANNFLLVFKREEDPVRL